MKPIKKRGKGKGERRKGVYLTGIFLLLGVTLAGAGTAYAKQDKADEVSAAAEDSQAVTHLAAERSHGRARADLNQNGIVDGREWGQSHKCQARQFQNEGAEQQTGDPTFRRPRWGPKPFGGQPSEGNQEGWDPGEWPTQGQPGLNQAQNWKWSDEDRASFSQALDSWLENHPRVSEHLDANQDGNVDQFEKNRLLNGWHQGQQSQGFQGAQGVGRGRPNGFQTQGNQNVGMMPGFRPRHFSLLAGAFESQQPGRQNQGMGQGPGMRFPGNMPMNRQGPQGTNQYQQGRGPGGPGYHLNPGLHLGQGQGPQGPQQAQSQFLNRPGLSSGAGPQRGMNRPGPQGEQLWRGMFSRNGQGSPQRMGGQGHRGFGQPQRANGHNGNPQGRALGYQANQAAV